MPAIRGGIISSFAYQVDIDVLLGNNVAEHGMFREYYGCWKAYIPDWIGRKYKSAWLKERGSGIGKEISYSREI